MVVDEVAAQQRSPVEGRWSTTRRSGQLMPVMRASEGFISHSGGPSPTGGWRVVEAWESEELAQSWFEENVKPKLPPGIVPDRTYHPLHTAFAK